MDKMDKISERKLGNRLCRMYKSISNDIFEFCQTIVKYADMFDPNDWHACVANLKKRVHGISNDEIMAAYFIGKEKLDPCMFGKKADVCRFLVKNVSISMQERYVKTGIRVAFEGSPNDEESWIKDRDFHDLKNCWISRWWNGMACRPYTDSELLELHAEKWPDKPKVKKGRTVEDSLGNKILLKTKTVGGTKMIYLHGWYSAEKLENISNSIN